MRTDEELMLSYKTGDERAFELLYERHAPTVYGYVRKKLTAKASADDVYQAIFLKLHKTRKNYNASIPFSAWIFTIARSVIIDHFRKQSRVLENPDTDFIETAAQKPAIAEGTSLAFDLSAVPERYQAALKMRYIDDLSFEEIAQKLNTSALNARQLISRGIKILRKLSGGESK
ncbi:MAG: RNA polymerase sigma factor [Bacteriovoracia bacterium]